ncbi:MAG: hypothetical protein N0C90_12945 [Candidatus Thiodiazotropha endolucinida]|nr:hypothetical protein [Candidatus Thiodiazotropha taylori]MCW4262268.1 hypothetical protein [Candidatus Thiodiazotropha endolucinida]
MHDTTKKLEVGKKVKGQKHPITIRFPRPLLAQLDEQVQEQDKGRAEILVESFEFYLRLKDRVALTLTEDDTDVQSNRPSAIGQAK